MGGGISRPATSDKWTNKPRHAAAAWTWHFLDEHEQQNSSTGSEGKEPMRGQTDAAGNYTENGGKRISVRQHRDVTVSV